MLLTVIYPYISTHLATHVHMLFFWLWCKLSKENKEVHATEPVEHENSSAVLEMDCVSDNIHDDSGSESTLQFVPSDAEAVSEHGNLPEASEVSFQHECENRSTSTPARLPSTSSGNCDTVVS